VDFMADCGVMAGGAETGGIKPTLFPEPSFPRFPNMI
jgi:hypothetical protein